MAIQGLRDNYAGTWGVGGAGTNAYSYGAPFKVSADCACTKIGWYRPSAGAQSPTMLRLYNRSTGGLMYDCSPVPASSGTGWKEFTFQTPIALVTTAEYMVVAGYPDGGGEASDVAANWPSLPSGFAAPTNYRAYASGSNSYPTSSDSSYFYGLSATIDTSQTGSQVTPPTTSGEVQEALSAWLSSTGNDYPTTSTPYLAYQDTQTIVDVLGGASSNWAGTVSTIIGAIKDQTDLLPAGIAQLTNAWLDDLLDQATSANDLVQQIVAGTAGIRVALDGGGSSFGSTYDQVDAIAGQVAQLLADGEQLATYADFPGAPWTMTDEQAFDTNLAYAEPAHLYVVSFSDLGSNVVNTTVSGVDVSYRLAWWTPLAGANAHQRRFIDTPAAHLYDNGHRMPGILLCSQAGGSGTIQAWSRF